jgi:signal transduction histidine kinase
MGDKLPPMSMLKPVFNRLVQGSQTALLGSGFAIVLLVALLTGYLAARGQEADNLVLQSVNAQSKTSDFLLALRRAESAQRGYLLSRQPSYLQDYRIAVSEVRPAFEDLRVSLMDDPVQQDTLDRLSIPTSSKLNEMSGTVAAALDGDFPAAVITMQQGPGRDDMENVRRQVEALASYERGKLEKRRTDSERTDKLLQGASLTGLALLVLIAAMSVILFRRTLAQREEARAELEHINANLEETIAERTGDLREANEEIQRFAYIVSHDLRSPLVNIMGFTAELEALRDDAFAQIKSLQEQVSTQLQVQADASKGEQLSKDFDEAIGFIKTSIKKMDRLINAILKLSREGRREFNPELLDMEALLKTISDTLAHQTEERGAQIEIGKLPPVTSDRLALEQVFSNLVDNALKYSQDGRPNLIAVRGQQTITQIIIEVSDSGRGIAPNDHQRIFELFRRAGQQDRPGEGIGLAHVRALVRRLGGTMSVTSELGKGSVFTVTLPRRWIGEQRSAA